MNNIIKTERLDLVPLDLNDQNQLIDILTNPQMTTYRESDFTISEIFDLISSSSSSISRGDVGLHALKLKGSDIIIGVIGIRKATMDNQEIYEALAYLNPKYWHSKYAKEALFALMQDAFDHGITDIHAFINMENYNMQFLLESLGYIKIGDQTINLNYNIVTRAHYIAHPSENKKTADDLFFVNF